MRGAQRRSREGWRTRAACSRSPGEFGPAPERWILRALPICCWTGLPCCSPTDALRRRHCWSGAATGFAGNEASIEEMLRWGWPATAAAVVVWDYEMCLAAATLEVKLARDSGALAVLAVGVNVLAQAVALGGDFGTAGLLIAEADAVTEATGTEVAPYGALVLAALQGREADAFALIDATIAEASAGGQGTAVQYARWASAVVLNALGRYQQALAAAQAASDDTPELFVSAWALSEVIEAATRIGKTEVARRALRRLAEHTHASQSDWALGLQARARALLSGPETAEPLYGEAIERFGRTRLRPELARAHLLYGEWLRRENRRVDAREQLRTATTSRPRSAWRHSPSAPAPSCWPPARRCASAPSRRATSSPLRSGRSRSSPGTAYPIPRSAPGCSSAPDRRMAPAQGVREGSGSALARSSRGRSVAQNPSLRPEIVSTAIDRRR
jgi:tetratricopeptide (TPR) repeat protein